MSSAEYLYTQRVIIQNVLDYHVGYYLVKLNATKDFTAAGESHVTWMKPALVHMAGMRFVEQHILYILKMELIFF